VSPVTQFPGSTNRGVHFQPFGYHGGWIGKAGEWIDLLHSMRISWVVILSEDDAVLKLQAVLGGRSVVQLFLDNNIQPVVRFAVKLDRGWPVMDHVRELVRQFAEYGLTPLVLIGNEPGDDREYAGDVPPDWDRRYLAYFQKHGSNVVQAGAVALFADGPGWPYNPFSEMRATWPAWEDGWMGYAGHWYGLNRPPDWPRDSVTQTGTPLLTEQDLMDWFGPFYDDRGLNDVPLWQVNHARINGVQPGLTPLQDPTCWRGWEQVADWMMRHFGRPLLMCLTEGGWTPGAVAGSGTDRDLRFPRPTPDTVARYTLDIMQAETPMLFQAPWLLGDSVLGGSGGWDMDAWCTGWWRHGGPEYWYYMPVVRALQQHPPDVNPAAVRVAAAQVRLAQAAGELAGIAW